MKLSPGLKILTSGGVLTARLLRWIYVARIYVYQLGEETQTLTEMTVVAREKFEKAKARFGSDVAELLACRLTEDAVGEDLYIAGGPRALESVKIPCVRMPYARTRFAT